MKFTFNERWLLQIAILVFALVPLLAGGAGIVAGAGMIDEIAHTITFDSHYSYLSGILFAIGLACWGMVPRIERHTARFRLITFLVVIGGLARLSRLVLIGRPSDGMLFGLGMELGVTPLLCLWQGRVARHFASLL